MTNTKYDIFISFKDLDASSKRTASSILAEEIYDSLDVRGYRVFYSRRVLPGMAGVDYEPEIQNALATAGLLVLVFTNAEEVNSEWVKYEWKYFLKTGKPILNVFKGGLRNVPHDISRLQGIDLTEDASGHEYEFMLKRIDEIIRGTFSGRREKPEPRVRTTPSREDPALKSKPQVEQAQSKPAFSTPSASAPKIEPRKAPAPDPAALFRMGQKNYRAMNFAKAAECYTKAAEAGSADAMWRLGLLYEEGEGVPQDYAKAIEWYTKAAKAGHAKAMWDLGFLYYSGEGVPQDSAKAAEWYTNAAKAGDTDAMISLGELYQDGEGVPQDNAKAIEWYTKAAEAGNADAMYIIGKEYDSIFGIIEWDESKAFEWYKKAAVAGNANAMYKLGVMYEEGVWSGYKKIQDYEISFEWYNKAANAHNPQAMYRLGLMFEEGKRVDQDYFQAIKWYEQAADTPDWMLTGVNRRAKIALDRVKAKLNQ